MTKGTNVAKKSPDRSATKIDAKGFNEVVASAKLLGLRLTGSSFDIKPDALNDEREKWTYNINTALDDWHLDCETRTLHGRFSYKVACTEGRRKPITVGATYLATYKLSRECQEESAVAYLNRVGRFSAYPYFRALFAVLTEQSGLLLPPLPVMQEPPRLVK